MQRGEETEKKISLRYSKSLFCVCVFLGWDGKEKSIMRENRKRDALTLNISTEYWQRSKEVNMCTPRVMLF